MVLQLVKNQYGVYEYKDPRIVDTTPNMTANEFEAYTAKSKTKLAGETTLGAQTDQLMREAPGQIEVITDPITGESKTVQKGGGAVEVEQQEFKTVTPTMVETPFEKAARMSAAFPMKKSPDLDKAYELIQRQNELAQKQQRLDNLFKGGDLALNLYRTYKTASEPLTTTALKGGAFDTTSFMGTQVGKSTLGSVGTAGAIGYGVGSALKIKGLTAFQIWQIWRLLNYLRSTGRYSHFGQNNQTRPSINLSTDEAYKILGIKKGSSKDEVIKAANSLQKKIHPDVNPNSNTERLSQIVNEAKETALKDIS